MQKILDENKIVARDQNKVFVERASTRRESARSVEEKYDLETGKGIAFVEFDIEPHLLRVQFNTRIQMEELFIQGSVDLTDRSAVGDRNM